MSRRLQNWLPQSQGVRIEHTQRIRRLRFFYFFCGNGHLGVRRSTGWFLIDNIFITADAGSSRQLKVQIGLRLAPFRLWRSLFRSAHYPVFIVDSQSGRFLKRPLFCTRFRCCSVLSCFTVFTFFLLCFLPFPLRYIFLLFSVFKIGRLPRLKHCSFSAQMSMPENSRQQSERLRLKWWELYAAVQTDLKSIRRWWSESCR